MNSQGIYTLANDTVYNQFVALLNSIEANVSSTIPICVIPFDQRLDRVKQEIDSRANVTLFDNWSSIQRWEDFAKQVVKAHPRAIETKLSHPRWYGGSLHRKFAAFDGPFEQFVFYDGDSLAMKQLDDVFEKLEIYDFIFDDWEHKKPETVAALNISHIEKAGFYSQQEIRSKLHCSSFFGSKKGLFDKDELFLMAERLISQGEITWINGQGWWDDAFLFNYLTLRCDRPLFNFTLSPHGYDRTGNCADADPFVNIDNVLYNQEGLKPIHRIHYMNYPSLSFNRLCQGEDVEICYKDVFLHYRFLKQPEQKPKQLKQPDIITKTSRTIQKLVKKLKNNVS